MKALDWVMAIINVVPVDPQIENEYTGSFQGRNEQFFARSRKTRGWAESYE